MVGKALTLGVVITMLAVSLAGCGQFASFEQEHRVGIAGQGQKSGADSKHLDCPGGRGQVAVGGQGQGTLTITVDDGAGDEIYRYMFGGNEQDGETRSVQGASGEWTLRVAFSGAYGVGAWNGQYAIYLSCSSSS